MFNQNNNAMIIMQLIIIMQYCSMYVSVQTAWMFDVCTMHTYSCHLHFSVSFRPVSNADLPTVQFPLDSCLFTFRYRSSESKSPRNAQDSGNVLHLFLKFSVDIRRCHSFRSIICQVLFLVPSDFPS